MEVRPSQVVAVLIAVVLAGLAVWRYGTGLYTMLVIAQAWLLLAVAYVDAVSRRVPNGLLVMGLMLALAASLGFARPAPLLALLGGLSGLGAFWLLARLRPGSLGMGDVKLAGLVGLILGLKGALVALPVGMVLGGIAALMLLATGRAARSQTMPYAPWLAAGAWVVMFFWPPAWL